jgi:hypothetical protein
MRSVPTLQEFRLGFRPPASSKEKEAVIPAVAVCDGHRGEDDKTEAEAWSLQTVLQLGKAHEIRS